MSYTINLNGRDLDGYIGYSLLISVKVKGYWSGDSISVLVNRAMFTHATKIAGTNYTISISHSSGGRDAKEVADDVEAEQYFGEALIGVAKFVREEIHPRLPMWERMYQEKRAAEEKRVEDEKKKQLAKIAEDAEVGEKAAKVIAQQMRSGLINEVVLYERGYDNSQTISRSVRPSGQVHFINHLGARFTFNQLVDTISRSSKNRLTTQ